MGFAWVELGRVKMKSRSRIIDWISNVTVRQIYVCHKTIAACLWGLSYKTSARLSDFLAPSPLVSVTNRLILVLSSAFWGLPSPHPLWTSYMEATSGYFPLALTAFCEVTYMSVMRILLRQASLLRRSCYVHYILKISTLFRLSVEITL